MEALPLEKRRETGIAPLAVRDDEGRFLRGNPGGPGRPAGRKDRINAALEALREHYRTPTQAEGIKRFVLDVLEGVKDNGERLELLRMLLPKESSAEIIAEISADRRPTIIQIVDATAPSPEGQQEAGA